MTTYIIWVWTDLIFLSVSIIFIGLRSFCFFYLIPWPHYVPCRTTYKIWVCTDIIFLSVGTMTFFGLGSFFFYFPRPTTLSLRLKNSNKNDSDPSKNNNTVQVISREFRTSSPSSPISVENNQLFDYSGLRTTSRELCILTENWSFF